MFCKAFRSIVLACFVIPYLNATVFAASASGSITINIIGTFRSPVSFPFDPNKSSGWCSVVSSVLPVASSNISNLSVTNWYANNFFYTDGGSQYKSGTFTLSSPTSFSCIIVINYFIPNTTGFGLGLRYHVGYNEYNPDTGQNIFDSSVMMPVAQITSFPISLTYNVNPVL